MALSDKEIQALKPREKRYKVTDAAMGFFCSSIPLAASTGT